MPAQQAEWTAEKVRALPDDGKRYELVDGELLVSPAPSWKHQAVLHRLFTLINAYAEANSLGWTRMSPQTSNLTALFPAARSLRGA